MRDKLAGVSDAYEMGERAVEEIQDFIEKHARFFDNEAANERVQMWRASEIKYRDSKGSKGAGDLG